MSLSISMKYTKSKFRLLNGIRIVYLMELKYKSF